MQEVWLRLSRNWELIRRDWTSSQIKAYVLTAVKHEFLFRIRCQKENELLVEPPSDEDFIEQILSKERYREVVAAIKAMEERYSIPLFYYFVQERSIKEIAAALHLPVKTVYTRVARGKMLLLECLKRGEKND